MNKIEIIQKELEDLRWYASKNHYIEEVIEEEEPFWWRINPKWAKKKAEEIVNKLKEYEKNNKKTRRTILL